MWATMPTSSPLMHLKMYQIAVENLCKARLHRLSSAHATLSCTLQEGNLVLIKSHTAGPFDPKYGSLSRVLKMVGNQVKLVPVTGGKLRREHRKHVKYILPAKKIISDMPEYERFGRKSKLRLPPLPSQTGMDRGPPHPRYRTA